MEHEISLGMLLGVFKKTWWKILIIALAVMIVAALFTHFFIPKKYSSSVDFYVVNVNTSYDYTTSTLLSASTYLINDYVSIIKSDYMLDKVCAELLAADKDYKLVKSEDITSKNIRGLIASASNEETSVFRLSISHVDAEYAYDVATTIAKLAPTVVTEMAKPESNLTEEDLVSALSSFINAYEKNYNTDTQVTKENISAMVKHDTFGLVEKLNCVEVITPPVLDKSADSPNIVSYTIIAGMAAAVITYIAFLIYKLMNINITTEDDVRKLLNRPLIGTIPSWEMTSSSRYSKYYKK